MNEVSYGDQFDIRSHSLAEKKYHSVLDRKGCLNIYLCNLIKHKKIHFFIENFEGLISSIARPFVALYLSASPNSLYLICVLV